MDFSNVSTIIDESNLSDEKKMFIVKYIEGLEEYNKMIQQENSMIKASNNLNAKYEGAKQYLVLRYEAILNLIDEVDSKLSDSICEECGASSKKKLLELADFIEKMKTTEETKIFDCAQHIVDSCKCNNIPVEHIQI
jgi:hypothetical protein